MNAERNRFLLLLLYCLVSLKYFSRYVSISSRFSCRKTLEDDSSRIEEFKNELTSIQSDLGRLKLPEILPDTLKEKEDAEAAAINVLASILDLIGRQFAYSKTFGGKFGKICFIF